MLETGVMVSGTGLEPSTMPGDCFVTHNIVTSSLTAVECMKESGIIIRSMVKVGTCRRLGW